MKILLRGDNTEVTQAMKDYALEKMAKLDKYIENQEATANILVKIRGYLQKIEVTIPLKKYILRAEETQENFYSAIDVIIDKLERQIRKNKTRLEHKYYQETKDISFIEDYPDEEEEKVVKRKKVEVKPMDEEEAILQMELLGHQFYLYKDADTNKPTVIYKRKDGNYGIIESE